MIVTRIEGGLGNQLFQVAFGMQLAQRHRTELALDLDSYAGKPEHGYLLDRFGVTARQLRQEERRRIPSRYRGGGSKWPALPTFGGLKRLREKPFGFNEKYLLAPDDSYVVGYWQSERYFRDVRDQVRSQFRPSVPLSDATKRLRERMLAGPSVAVHVRRGDYVSNPQAAAIYRNLTADYYRGCVLTWLVERAHAEVVVFSNDIPWCRSALALPCPVHFVEHTTGGAAHEDLWLMTAAQCQVIANSTFSWWGAWLAERADHRVLAPRRWFHPGTLDDRHLACQGWSLMEESSVDSADASSALPAAAA